MAHVFGAYLVKNHKGIFDDPQLGAFYDAASLMELEIDALVHELRAKERR